MTMEDELNKATSNKKPVIFTPPGWAPRVEFDDKSGEGVTTARPASDAPLSHIDILNDFNLDPDRWRVKTVRMSRWQAQAKDHFDPIVMEACKATFEAISSDDPKIVQEDAEELLRVISGWKYQPAKNTKQGSGPKATFVIAASDWQLGKGEGGGTSATLSRINNSFNAITQRVRNLRMEGYQIDTALIVGLGDMQEQCQGHYAMQTHQADLDMRSQRRLTWRTLLKGIYLIAPSFEEVIVTGIGGNHGESRVDGKAFTTFEDNDDLLMLDAAKDIIEAGPLKHVRVELPEDPLAHVVETSGVKVGMVHGHQFRSGKGATEKAHQWWKDQMMGLRPIKDANILLNGHFHHLAYSEYSENGRYTFQAPAMDGGSYWFTSSSGESAAPGMLTLLVGTELGARQWDDLKVL